MITNEDIEIMALESNMSFQAAQEVLERGAWQDIRNSAFLAVGRKVRAAKIPCGNRHIDIEGANGIGFVLLTSAGFSVNDAAGHEIFPTLDLAVEAANEFVRKSA